MELYIIADCMLHHEFKFDLIKQRKSPPRHFNARNRDSLWSNLTTLSGYCRQPHTASRVTRSQRCLRYRARDILECINSAEMMCQFKKSFINTHPLFAPLYTCARAHTHTRTCILYFSIAGVRSSEAKSSQSAHSRKNSTQLCKALHIYLWNYFYYSTPNLG